jgi:hypothetical protein
VKSKVKMPKDEFYRIVHECGLSSDRLTQILYETCPTPDITEDELRKFMHHKDTVKCLRVCLGMLRGEKWAFEEAFKQIAKYLEEHGVFLVILEIRSDAQASKIPSDTPGAQAADPFGKTEADVIDDIASMFGSQPIDPRKAN